MLNHMTHNKPLNLEHLVRQTWICYQPKIRFLALLMFASSAIVFLTATILTSIIAFAFEDQIRHASSWLIHSITRGTDSIDASLAPTGDVALTIALLLISTIFFSVLITWTNATIWSGTLRTDSRDIRGHLRAGWRALPLMFALTILRPLLILAGLALFVLPGLIFAGWFMFTDITIMKHEGLFAGMKTSAGLVADRWFEMVVPLIMSYLFIATPVIIIETLMLALHQAIGIPTPVRASVHLLLAAGIILFGVPWLRIYKKQLFDDAKNTVDYRSIAESRHLRPAH